MAPAPAPVSEPFPISCIAGRYLLFDVDVIAHCRRAHNICGLLVGTIPNLSQQNVFLGVPLELMPEEARVLVEKGHAYVVDDVEVHRKGFMEMGREERLKILQEMDQKGLELAREEQAKADARKEKALREKGLKGIVAEKKAKEVSASVEKSAPDEAASAEASNATEDANDGSLFDSTPASPSPSTVSKTSKVSSTPLQRHYITPTTSHPPLASPSVDSALPFPPVPKSYPLFRYLHSRGYFAMPGLRFGCHYSVYPGDPLRFHSHFLATGMDWDQEFDLVDIVGGGRLGTGVKKAFLVGGEEGAENRSSSSSSSRISGNPESARAFSIEWAAM